MSEKSGACVSDRAEASLHLRDLGDRRVLAMLLLGVAAGLPFFLIFDTLSAWLRQSGVSLQTITVFALATLSYALKFVWAPIVDRMRLPVIGDRLGQRRSWMILTQAIIIIGLFLIAGSQPDLNLTRVALLAVLVGFAGATQDIAIDAWRIESVDETRYGVMAAAYQWGYRGAMITAGAVPLFLADAFNWNLSYAVMAVIMMIGVGASLLAPRETAPLGRAPASEGMTARPRLEIVEWGGRLSVLGVGALLAGSGLAANATLLADLLQALGMGAEMADALRNAWQARPGGVFIQFVAVIAGLSMLALACVPVPGLATRPGAYLRRAYGEPLANFFQRFGGGLGALILALICLYRLSDFVLNLMNPFYIDLGFSLSQIAEVRKIFGVVASLAGIAVAGVLVARLGIIATMLIGVFASPLSNLVFVWLATQGPDMTALYISIMIDNFAMGVAGTALIVYMSSLTKVGFTATQYALFSSLYAIFGKIIASQSGRVVEAAARSAEQDGLTSVFRGLFSGLPETSLATGAASLSVTPASLGAGYVTFFLYSATLGAAAIVLAFSVARRQRQLAAARSSGEASPPNASAP